MTTIINNPDTSGGNSGGVGLIVGAVVIIAIIALFFLYGLPALRKSSSGTTVNVPDKIQVDVNK
jgi:hypothetical protein